MRRCLIELEPHTLVLYMLHSSLTAERGSAAERVWEADRNDLLILFRLQFLNALQVCWHLLELLISASL